MNKWEIVDRWDEQRFQEEKKFFKWAMIIYGFGFLLLFITFIRT